eukprot:GHVS01048156.1.p1 GENE.GHVS01048156.1~~GHVS01048156.1.p1  ORF type:complete len:189 (+),score=32.11 GHVS01048156.1:63-629(+)
MARNSEKSMAMLNRWVTMKTNIVKGIQGRRPRNVEGAETVRDCEHWRNQVIRDVSRKISEIQNAGLGEHRIRDLNDEINYLLREKFRWELKIKEMGGADYRTRGGPIDNHGTELMGQGGYRYFGAAKDLPGIRELFEKEPPPAPKKTRAELSRGITPDYYGWRDEEDGELVLAEQAKEQELRQSTAVT